ncbi:MAG: hypothetical protein AB1744_02805 [Candidatus Zixiibacteriota bacterium]
MGRSKKTTRCPRRGSSDVFPQDSFDDGFHLYVCADCDHKFEVGGSRVRRRGENYDIDDYFDHESTEDEWER